MAQRKTMIGVLVGKTERELLERAAGDQPVSAWMRDLTLDVARLVLNPPETKQRES